ncbi:hypothetical protein ACQP3J_31195, partial [Escherichia coli]
ENNQDIGGMMTVTMITTDVNTEIRNESMSFQYPKGRGKALLALKNVTFVDVGRTVKLGIAALQPLVVPGK